MVILLLLCSLVTLASSQTKRALVIGIGRYEDKAWGTINGDKDVPLMVAMLKNAGFTHIVTLVNQQATKARIEGALKKLAQKCKSGDRVVIHFSGHGQQMTDLDGDEKDLLDEAWIPYDAYRKYCTRDRGEKHLSDDEINKSLTAIRNKIGSKGEILVVVDACHSGDSSRGEEDETVRGVFDKFVIPTQSKVTLKAPLKENWCILSACKDYQLNVEMKNPKAGKLTYGICTLLKDSKITNNDRLMKQLEQFMNQNSSRAQTPLLQGLKEINIVKILR